MQHAGGTPITMAHLPMLSGLNLTMVGQQSGHNLIQGLGQHQVMYAQHVQPVHSQHQITTSQAPHYQIIAQATSAHHMQSQTQQLQQQQQQHPHQVVQVQVHQQQQPHSHQHHSSSKQEKHSQHAAGGGRQHHQQQHQIITNPLALQMAQRSQNSHKKKKPIKVNKDGIPAPKRATTAYINFTQWYREEVKKSGREVPKIGEFGKECAGKWNTMSDTEKKPFLDSAERDRARYRKEMDIYKPPKDKSKPKRPSTAFMIFMNDFRASIKGKEPEGGVSAVAKLGGEKWRSMTDDDKRPYHEKQNQEKARYETSMEEYRRKNPFITYAGKDQPAGVVVGVGAVGGGDEGEEDDGANGIGGVADGHAEDADDDDDDDDLE